MAIEHDTVDRWLPARETRVVSLVSARAERAEQRAAVLAGREATSAARLLAAEQARDQYRADFLTLSRERRRLLIYAGTTLALAAFMAVLTALVAFLAALVCLWAIGWRGPVLVAGIVIAAAAWALTRYWEGGR